MVSAFSQDFWKPGVVQVITLEYRYLFWALIGSYLPLVWLGQRFMKHRDPMRLKWVSFGWNIGLSLFSALGALVYLWNKPTVLLTLDLLDEDNHPWIRATMAFFALSKLAEFGDTFLLVFKKKPLIFLHVYHHLTVAMYGWYSQAVAARYCHLFAFINLVIHSWMYLYYALAIVIPRHPLLRAVRPYITMSQILQMFVGMTLASALLRLPSITGALRTNAICALLMYVSYAYLFILFYLENYVKGVHPIMTVAVGTMHIAAVFGLKLLWEHPQRVHLAVEIAICYVMSVLLVQHLASTVRSIGKNLKSSAERSAGPSRWMRSSLMVLNTWMTWAVEHQQLQRFYEDIVGKKSEDSSMPKNAESTAASSKEAQGGAVKRQRYLAQDLMADMAPVAQQLVKHCDDKKDVNCDESNTAALLRTIPLYFGQSRFKEDWILFAASMLLPALYGRGVYGSAVLGFVVHGCLRWCIELYTTGHLIAYPPRDDYKTC